MTDDEVIELGKVTLHGPVPADTVRRLWMRAVALIRQRVDLTDIYDVIDENVDDARHLEDRHRAGGNYQEAIYEENRRRAFTDLKKRISEAHSGPHAESEKLRTTIREQEERIKKLRGYLVDVINLGTDGAASVDVSDDFLSHTAAECAAIKRKLDLRKHTRA
jgi:hypothetical protein